MMTRALPFVDFVKDVLGLPLTLGQRVICRVAFDGVDPHGLEGPEREMARRIFGDVETVPPEARRIVCLRMGRGSAKTTLAAAYALYQLCTADVSMCGPGDVPVVAVVAPDKRTAAIAVRMGLEFARRNRAMARFVENETLNGFLLRRHDGRQVTFEVFAASRGGATVRGRTILAFVLDECEFFRGDNDGYVINDRDMYRALVPRLVPKGKGVFISTPWPCETLMGELVAKNFGHPSTALVAIAPTLTMRDDDPELVSMIALEKERDPNNAAREFDCVTSSNATAGFFDMGAVSDCIDPCASLPAPVPEGAHVAVAVDLGFVRDSTALAAVAISPDQCVHLLALEELRPHQGAPIKPSEAMARATTLARSVGTSVLWSDGHYRESIREHLARNQIDLASAPEGQAGKAAVYLRARELFYERRLRIPNHPRLLAQLRAVVSKPMPGGGLSIQSPRRMGSDHGDLVSALTLALWAVVQGHGSDERVLVINRGRSAIPNPYQQKGQSWVSPQCLSIITDRTAPR